MDRSTQGIDDEIDSDLAVPQEEEFDAYEHLEPVGTEPIEGEDMHVFELTADEFEEYDYDVTYYVSVETGHLRRVVHGEMVMDFRGWGDVDPVEPPDMECADMAEQGT